MRHPIQPLSKDENGTIRFKENAIVRFLLDSGPFDLNQLAVMNFSRADREQFAQLIGYSLSSFSELSYVSDETYNAAKAMSQGESEQEARIKTLEQTLHGVRQGMINVIPHLFKIHPGDLMTEYL